MLRSFLPLKRPIVFDAFARTLPDRVVVFGTGERGRRCKQRLERLQIKVTAFADNNPERQGTVLDGAPVIAAEDIATSAPEASVIICSYATEVIFRQLRALGHEVVYTDFNMLCSERQTLEDNADKVREVAALLGDEESRTQYKEALALRFLGQPIETPAAYRVYHHPRVRPRRGDCIVDGGAATGDTLETFWNDCGGDCSLHLFEPTPESFDQMCRSIRTRGFSGAVPVNRALWCESAELHFCEDVTTSHANHLAADGEIVVRATSLDQYVRENGVERVDLIKLDIEGAELEALRGARETLRRDKPRLQICLYHRDNHLWDVPLLIHEIVPEYTMYLGHHTRTLLDTLLYCEAA